MKKLIAILMVVGGIVFIIKKEWKRSDFRLGIISPEKIALLSISPGRGMINLLTINPEVEVWIPGGMGWYASNKINKIAVSQKNSDIAKEIFYYNFGFIPDKVAYLSDISEWRDWNLIKYLGPVDWLRYLLKQEDWLYKTEVVNGSLGAEKENLDEILPRDFAESELLDGGISLSVINASEENGLGSFVADRLNWMGFNVVEVGSEKAKEGCEIMVGITEGSLIKKYSELIAKIYKCSQVSNATLLPNEAVLYLGESYASMIKYNSYKK